MKSEVVSSVTIDPMNRVYCCTPWGNCFKNANMQLLQE